MLVTFASKNFQSGLTITFKLYKLNGTLISQKVATEVGNTGVYYADVDTGAVRDIICIAEDGNGWKAYRYIGRT